MLLWMGMMDPLFEGRLLPFMAFIAFLFILYPKFPQMPLLGRRKLLLIFGLTTQVWLGMASYYSNVPLMVFACAGGFALMPPPDAKGAKPRIWWLLAAVLFSVSVLLRPDGLAMVTVLVVCFVFHDFRNRFLPGALSIVLPLAFAFTWWFRPEDIKGISTFIHTISGDQLKAWGAGPSWRTVLNFLYAAQGLYLAHYGFGLFFYAFATVGIWSIGNWRVLPSELRLCGLISLGFFVFAAACYLGIGVFLNPSMDYVYWIRVSLGRLTVHLYPFMLLFVAHGLRIMINGNLDLRVIGSCLPQKNGNQNAYQHNAAHAS
jgi:hypothetical protein